MDYSFKKILIALDASENAMRAIRYCGEIAGNTSDFHVTLLHVMRYPARDHYPSDKEWKQACDSLRTKGKQILSEAVELLQTYGLDNNTVTTMVVESKSASIAAEILKIQKEGGYGTVAVGRRGVSKAEEFLFGSVSNRIVHYAVHCTVWVVE